MAINFLQSTKLPDDVKLQFGDSEDLQIYHTGSNSFIQDLGIGSLYIDGSSVYIRANLNENAVVCLQNSEVQIFHNGSEKMATKSTGISVTGGVTTSSSSDLAGANMSASIAMGANAITGMADPSSAQDAATKAYVDSQISGVPQGTVTSVSGTSPISSSGGTTPAISIATANGSTTGALSSTDWNTFNNKGSGSMSSWLLTGDSGGSATIDNGETVDIAGGTNITTARSGNTVTINTSATTNTGTVTSVATGTGLSGGTITGSGTISVDNTVVLTNNTQTISGGKTFSDVLTATSDIDMENGGDILLSATGGIQIDGDPGVGKFLKSVASGMEWTTITQNSGTVTSVATSSPITGGTITGSGTIGFDSSAVTSLSNLATTGTVTTGTWNSNTRLDKTSTTDNDYQGELVYLGGTTVVKGKLYQYSGGDWIAADADAESTSKGLLAMAVANGNSGTVGMLTRGMFTLSYDPGNDGDILYISTTAGNLTTEPPSGSQDVVRIVGTLLDSTNGQMFFHPDNTYITLS